jgi:hypothetical protein
MGGGTKLDIRVIPKIPKEKSFEKLTISVEVPFVVGMMANATHGTCIFDSTTKVFQIDVDDYLVYWTNSTINSTLCFYNTYRSL